jgi:hypothetical protein
MRGSRYGLTFSLIALNIDNYKRYSAIRGTNADNELIKTISM